MIFDGCPDVRFAAPGDEDALMNLMREAHAESGEHPLSEAKVFDMVSNGVVRNRTMIGVVGEMGAALRAYILMCMVPVWYSDDFQLLELSNFVHPEHRRSSYAKQLISFAKYSAEALGLDLMIGVYSNDRTEAKVRLYERQLVKKGALFSHRPHVAA